MAKNPDLEEKLQNVYQKLPKLSPYSSEWLSNNVWWMAVIGVAVLGMTFFAETYRLLAALGVASGTPVNVTADIASFTPYSWVAVAVRVIQYAVVTILLVFAVSPLRERTKQGWTLLYWAFLINFGLEALLVVLAGTFGGLLMTVFRAFLAGYLLFNIQNYFVIHRENRAVKRIRHLVKRAKK